MHHGDVQGDAGRRAADPRSPPEDREERTRRSARRQTWADATVETTAALLRDADESPMSALATRLRAVAGADGVTVLRTAGAADGLAVVATSGTAGTPPRDDRPTDEDVAAVVLRAGQPWREEPDRSAAPDRGRRRQRMAAPLRSGSRVVGVVLVARTSGGTPFDDADLESLATFVDHASIAIELAETRLDRERAVLLEDRARIARDLHDTAIQQLFAAGLELRATAASLGPAEASARVLHAVDLVEVAIGQIRTAVLALSAVPGTDSLRRQVIDVVRDLALPFPTTPDLTFDGPVDLIGQGLLAEDVVAVIRESLANAAKHAAADHVGVAVRALGDRVEVEVWDDGVGPPDHPVRSGLANLEERAAARGGTFLLTRRSPGTSVVWRAPAATGEADA